MEQLIVAGGRKLSGAVSVSGAKNVALKALVAACLTEDPVIIENIPLISDFHVMTEIIGELGGNVTIQDHTATIEMKSFRKSDVALTKAANIRASSMFLAPLLARTGQAVIPNPGGCRIGARPIDRVIDGLTAMGTEIDYMSEDGNFHARTKKNSSPFLTGTTYVFEKNTHTGTETLILAAVLASGKTILENAAEEPEVDELIELLNSMGARITRSNMRTISIEGVEKLHGTTFRISPDRNEIVTLAVAAIITEGDIVVQDAHKSHLKEFLHELEKIGGGVEEVEDGMRFFYKGPLKATHITTAPYPGFMTDWQGPWAVLMTKAHGESIIHETVYENRFSYVGELRKMGAHIELFNPVIDDAEKVYNFNVLDDRPEYLHAAKINGPTNLHNGVVTVSDLRAGATLILGALAAIGESVIFGVHHLDRGYERLDQRLGILGADIKRVEE